MALDRIGLGGVLEVDDTQAKQALGRTRDEFGRFVAGANSAARATDMWSISLGKLWTGMGAVNQITAGMQQIGGAFRAAGLAAIPLTGALVLGAKSAAEFEYEMSAVSAITGATKDEMVQLTDTANEMGAASKFTATEAAQAMQFMGLAGAETQQIIEGIPGVMAAAAAESIDLATSADIVAQSTNIMGRSWGQAKNTADILTLAAQKSNTDIINLGESLKYGGLVARNVGMSLETTSGILGKLADAGLRGSIGGTALSHALEKLAKPSKHGGELIEALGLKMTKTEKGSLDFVDIVDQLNTKLKDVKDPLERTRIATEIFGVQGARAFNALAAAGKKSTNKLIADLERASEGEGAAAIAAGKRMDNFMGALELFSGQVEAFANKLFLPMMEPLKNALKAGSEFIESILVGIGELYKAGGDTEKRYDALVKLWGAGGETMVAVAYGIIDAIEGLRSGLKSALEGARELFSFFGATLSGETVRSLVKFAIMFGVIAGAVAPVIGALWAIHYVITAIIWPAISGTFAVITGTLLGPLTLVAAGLMAVFLMVRRDGESVGETFSRVWDGIKQGAEAVWGVLTQIWTGLRQAFVPGIERLATVWIEVSGVIKAALNDVASHFSMLAGDASVDWQEVGQIVGAVIMTAAELFVRLFAAGAVILGVLAKTILTVSELLLSFMVPVFGEVYLAAMKIWDALVMIFSGDQIMNGMVNLAKGIFDFVVIPLKSVLMQIIALADAVGGGGLVPEAIRDFALKPEKIGTDKPKAAGGAFDTIIGNTPARPRVVEDSRARQEFDSLGKEVLAKRAAAGTKVDVNVKADIPPAQIDINNTMKVDGTTLALASERHKQEVGERAGFKTTPWQRRARVEHGATPTRG